MDRIAIKIGSRMDCVAPASRLSSGTLDRIQDCHVLIEFARRALLELQTDNFPIFVLHTELYKNCQRLIFKVASPAGPHNKMQTDNLISFRRPQEVQKEHTVMFERCRWLQGPTNTANRNLSILFPPAGPPQNLRLSCFKHKFEIRTANK